MGAVVQSNFSAAGTPSLLGVTAGNCLVLFTDFYRTFNTAVTQIPAPTDTGGTMVAAGSAAPVPMLDGASNSWGASVWYEKNCAAGTHAVVVSPGSGTTTNNALLVEISGLDTAAPLDVSAASPGGGSTTQSRASGTTAAIAQTNSLAFAACAMVAGSGQANIGITDPPAGYTSLYVEGNSSTNVGGEVAYKNGLSAGTQSTNWTWTDASTVGSVGMIAVFKDSGAVAARQQTLTLLGVGI